MRASRPSLARPGFLGTALQRGQRRRGDGGRSTLVVLSWSSAGGATEQLPFLVPRAACRVPGSERRRWRCTELSAI